VDGFAWSLASFAAKEVPSVHLFVRSLCSHGHQQKVQNGGHGECQCQEPMLNKMVMGLADLLKW